VTVRVTTLKGAAAGDYYVKQLPNYYLQSGEPRGIWFGDGATTLALIGDVDDEAFVALMAGMDPTRPDRHLGRSYDDKSVRGFDVTASAPKSVSVLFALGDLETRRQVLAAHDDAVGALAAWIERHAHTRYRIGGEVAVVAAVGIVAAAFRQHTSRALDPQLHTHLVIANRVKSPDGRWLALDARLIKHDQQSLSAIYHACLRAELTRRLGVRWHDPEHGIAEIRDVPEDVIVEFSARTTDVRRRIDDKLDRFIDTMGREPTPRERWKLEREAAIDSRPAKAHSVEAAALHAAWAEQTRQLGHDPVAVVSNAVEQVPERRGIDSATRSMMIDQTIEAMGEKQSTWRPTELHRELAAVVPTATATTAAQLASWLDGVVDEIVTTRCVDVSRPVPSDALLRRDGRPVTESIVDRALTTQAILDQERALIEWADRRFVHDGPDEPAAAARSTIELNVAQTKATCAVAGHADLVLIVGPAGTGKTTALSPAVAQLRADGRVVFGVAPSATAAEVLQEETGVVADTLDKLLIEHRLARPPDHRYDLPVGTTVIVDEAGMMATAKLAELAALADLKGWRLALVGDPLQFSAVGRGGMFGLLVDTFGAIELDHPHRFDEEWEREASLRLLRGDVSVAEIYEAHGRLHGGTVTQMERASVDRWWELRAAGKKTLLMTPTNEAAERLNQRCQRTRIRAGEIDPNSRHVTAGPYEIHIGDEIATRHNERRIITDRGATVKNRAVWTVDSINADGSLTATGRAGTVRLPAVYVAEHVDLAYARTGIGGQGRNVKGGLLFAERPTDVRNIYVPMTRGTETNEAFLVTTGEQTALDVFIQSLATDWIDQSAIARQAELNDTKPHRPGLLDGSQLRVLLEQRYEITSSIEKAEYDLKRRSRDLRDAEAAKAAAEKAIRERTIAHRQAKSVIARYDRPLHRRKHEIDIADATRDIRRLPGLIENARNEANSAEQRIEQIRRSSTQASDVLKRGPSLASNVAAIDHRLSNDSRVRSRIARLEQPKSITGAIGDRPPPGPASRDWDLAAGRLAQHQAAFDIDDGFGRQPGYLDHSAYSQSRDSVIEIAHPFIRPVAPRGIERSVPELHR
jgi:conjugative relaxase-like TrwC/TraI family protein